MQPTIPGISFNEIPIRRQKYKDIYNYLTLKDYLAKNLIMKIRLCIAFTFFVIPICYHCLIYPVPMGGFFSWVPVGLKFPIFASD
jgi:hypothetical protein